MKRNPQIQKAEPGDDSAHCSAAGNTPEGRELQKERILIPEHGGPGRVTDCEADIHAQHDAQKQFDSHKPFWDALRHLIRRSRRSGHAIDRLSGQRIWTNSERGRSRFRQLRHALKYARRSRDLNRSAGVRHKPEKAPARLCDAVLQRYHSGGTKRVPVEAAAPVPKCARFAPQLLLRYKASDASPFSRFSDGGYSTKMRGHGRSVRPITSSIRPSQ